MASIGLKHCLEVTDSDGFRQCLAAALKVLPRGTLPLQAGCNQGGLVDDSDISVTVLGVEPSADPIIARVGVFFTEIVGGCNCNDAPLGANAYCVIEVAIDRTHGHTGFRPLEN